MVSFPNLGLVFNISPVAFTIFGRGVHWYGIIMALSVISGGAMVLARAKRRNMNGDMVIDCIIWSLISAFIGARCYFVLFNLKEYNSFWEMIQLWNGGIAIYGGVIGGALGVYIFCRKRGVNFIEMADLMLPCVLLGQAIGRWGNFTNQEAYGSEYYGFWRMEIGNNLSVHPTFLYESVWNLLGVLVILFAERLLGHSRRKSVTDIKTGISSLLYIVWYGLGRFFIEGLRVDSLPYGASWKVSQVLAGASCLIALGVLIVKIRKKN